MDVCDRVGYLIMDTGQRFVTSETVDATAALQGRFVSHIYPHDRFRDEVVAFAPLCAQQTHLKQDPLSHVPG